MSDEKTTDASDRTLRIGDGGPAFPCQMESSFNPATGLTIHATREGMTLRDWFAGQALSGLIAHASGEDPHKAPALAYKLADDMFEMREVAQ